jgi:PTH2 family peptidyl-tRNA hydrolase
VRPRLPSTAPEPERAPEVRILLNRDVPMSRGKACAQAVHAAFRAFDVRHGRVVVLTGTSDVVAAMPVVIRDAGLTEVEPGTLTAGATVPGRPAPERPVPG